MTYKIKKEKKKKKKTIEMGELKGYSLAASTHRFTIEEVPVKNIVVFAPKFIKPLISKKVKKKFDRLMTVLTNLLVSDDEDGDNIKEALDLIEKFRLEIKVKYRKYLKEQELKEMGNKLKKMQQVAYQREMEIKAFLAEEYMGKSR